MMCHLGLQKLVILVWIQFIWLFKIWASITLIRSVILYLETQYFGFRKRDFGVQEHLAYVLISDFPDTYQLGVSITL